MGVEIGLQEAEQFVKFLKILIENELFLLFIFGVGVGG
jgi:hypothetical protein